MLAGLRLPRRLFPLRFPAAQSLRQNAFDDVVGIRLTPVAEEEEGEEEEEEEAKEEKEEEK